MSKLIEPLHIATLNGSLVRFFAPPDGKPDHPWHSTDDLQQCCGLSAQQRTVLPRLVRKTEWAQSFQTIPTAFGLVTIAPHLASLGFIGAMIQVGLAPKRLEHDYVQAAVTAMMKLVPQPIVHGSPWYIFLREQLRGQENDPQVRAFFPGWFLDDDDSAAPDAPAEPDLDPARPDCWYRKVNDPSDPDGYYYEMGKEGMALLVLDPKTDGAEAGKFKAEFGEHYQAMQAKLGENQRGEAQAVWERWRADPQSTVCLVELIQQFVAMEKMFGPGAGTAEFWQRWTPSGN